MEPIGECSLLRDGRKLMVYQDRIWAIGGFNSISSTSVSSVDSFDPRDEFLASRSIPHNPKKLASGMGWKWRNLCRGRDNGAPLNTVEFYDRATKNWISNGTLPYALWWGGSIQSDGFAYMVGGAESTAIFFDKVYAADITPPMDLYYRENSSAGSVTLGKLSSDIVGKLNQSKPVSLTAGMVTSVGVTITITQATTPSLNEPTGMPVINGRKWHGECREVCQ